MQLSVSGKHLDIGDSLRVHVTDAIAASAKRYFGNAIEGKVVFQRARSTYRADISLHVARGISVQSHAEAADPYVAFDTAAERLNKRLRRHKRRLVDRRRAGETNGSETGGGETGDGAVAIAATVARRTPRAAAGASKRSR